MKRSALILSAVTIALLSNAAAGQGPTSAFDRPSTQPLSLDEIRTADVQKALIWTMHYGGMVDGDYGKLTRAAAASWQRAQGRTATGILDPSDAAILVVQGMRSREAWGWTTFRDDAVGFSLGYAGSLFSLRPRRSTGVVEFTSTVPGGHLRITVIADGRLQRFLSIYETASRPSDLNDRVEYAARTDAWFVVSGVKNTTWYYVRVERRASGIVSFYFSMPEGGRTKYGFLATAMSNAFRVDHDIRPEPGTVGPNNPPPTPPSASAAPPFRGKTVSGTAFYLNGDGYLVTNSHVVDGCSHIGLKRGGIAVGTAEVYRRNERDDLAVLKQAPPSPSYVRIRVGDPLRPAEPITVFGFPLAGVLSTGGNTTLGNVTALAGLGDDYRYFQLSAPVQHGNSGGPVLDNRGRLVGVVVSKLDAIRVAGITGDIPQNVNFAIKASTLTSFLESQGIRYETSIGGSVLEASTVGELAAAASVMVECTISPSVASRPSGPSRLSAVEPTKEQIHGAFASAIDTHTRGGMAGLNASIGECYERAIAARNATEMATCLAMDWLGSRIDLDAASANRWPPNPHNSTTALVARIDQALTAIGYESGIRAELIREWQSTIAHVWARRW